MSYTILPAQKIIEHFTQKLSTIRTGRVNASILDSLSVEAYGSRLSIREIATITIPEPSQLLITPFDKGLITAIEKTVQESNLGVNPGNDGAGVRLIFPPMTEENRKSRIKEVGKLLEETRISIRNSRHDVLKHKKREQEDSLISEDDYNRYETIVQKEVDNLNKEVEQLAKSKEEDLLRI